MEMSTTLESLIENKQFCIFSSALKCFIFLVGSGCVEQRIEGLTEFDKIKRKKMAYKWKSSQLQQK